MAFSSASLPIVARGSLRPSLGLKVPIAPFLYPQQQQQVRGAKNKFQNKIKGDTKKKAKGPREYKRVDLKNITQFSLCDAMRCAFSTLRHTLDPVYGGDDFSALTNVRTIDLGTFGLSKSAVTAPHPNTRFTFD
jgi:hypothetical protein